MMSVAVFRIIGVWPNDIQPLSVAIMAGLNRLGVEDES